MQTFSTKSSKGVGILTAVLLLGFIIGRLTTAGSGVAAADATPATGDIDTVGATQTAEHDELERLRTQVAQTPPPAVCTMPPTNTPSPSPTPTATPTMVPPATVGQQLTYGEDWTVVVNDISLIATFSDVTPQAGAFAKVSLTITNNGSKRQRFPYDELVLRDEQGRTFLPSRSARLVAEAGWFAWFSPSLPTDGFVIFDIATDATGPFILESTADPTFRVQIAPAARG